MDAESWDDWWEAAAREPAFASLLAERARRFGARRHGDGITITQAEYAFRDAGFREVGTIVQEADRRLLVAIR